MVETVLSLAGALQRASATRDVVSAYLSAIPDVVGGAGHGLYLLDPDTLRPVEVAATVPDAFLARYEEEGRAQDPVLARAVQTGGPVDSSRLPPDLPWETSPVAGLLQQAGYFHSLEAPVVVDGEVHATLNMARPHDAHPFSDDDLSAVGAVAEQVGAALTRARRHDKVTAETVMLADALDAAAQPIVITTTDGQLIFGNRMAVRPVPGSSASYLERATSPLLEALDDLRSGTKRVATAQERPPEPGPDGRRAPAAGVVGVKAVRLRARHDAVVSFLSHRPSGSVGLPSAPTPLSPRERHIADLVSQGLTTRQIAELSYVSENTVKQHLKRIYAKLEVKSRAELVQAVWRSAADDPSLG